MKKRILSFPLLLFVFCFLAYAQDGREYSVSTKLHSDLNKAWDIASWDFDANRYGQVRVDLEGDWRVMWFNSPSQHFKVSVNGKVIYDEDLAGKKSIYYTLDTIQYKQPLKVEIAMSLGNHSHNASGSAKVTCIEGQVGRFYVEEVTYDFSKKVQLPDEFIRGEGADYNNETSGTTISHQFTLNYTVSESLHWEKNFSNAFTVDFSGGYNPPLGTGGGHNGRLD